MDKPKLQIVKYVDQKAEIIKYINQNIPPELTVPLQFWFDTSKLQQRLSPEERIQKLCNDDNEFKTLYNRVLYCYHSTINTQYKKISDIYDDIDYLEMKYSRQVLGNCVVYPKPIYMQDFYDFADGLCKRYDSKYETELYISKEESINGYNLYDTKTKILRRKDYDILVKDWNKNKQYTQKGFLKLYNKKACTEWSKMDEHGNHYQGYYLYPEGSYERENAYSLTRKANGLALWKLPYPKKVILKSIDYGCGSHKESVRFSNYICEWIKRKMEQMNTIPSLQSICKDTIILKNINTYELPYL